MTRVRVDKKFAKFCGFEIFEVLWTGYVPMKREFKTGTFDLRGLVDEHKQNLLNQDLNNYRVRVVVYNK